MGFTDFVFKGMPRGIEKMAALVILLINVIAPGIGTIISAFLADDCETETVVVGVLQALSTPLLGLGLFWAIAWSVKLCKTSSSPSSDEENPLVQDSSS